MNTVDFVVGQLLSFEMMTLAKLRPHQRFRQYVAHQFQVQRFPKERIVENQLLIILFLVVSLIANFTVMATPEK
ncbi:MAG: hypothetical protein KDE19_07590 [Caldilineaceae bacterium]|nr:hypothetical protein [Caldilineaceae bacterium]